MLTSCEIARGSQGAVKFLWRDVSAPLHFDNTFEACLHSFQVMILVAPIYALYFVVFYAQPQVTVEADEALIVLVESSGSIPVASRTAPATSSTSAPGGV